MKLNKILTTALISAFTIILVSCSIDEDVVDVTPEPIPGNSGAVNPESTPVVSSDPISNSDNLDEVSDPTPTSNPETETPSVTPAPVIPSPPANLIFGSGTIQTFPGYDFRGDFELVRENGRQELRLGSDFGGGAPRTAVFLSNSNRSTFGGVLIQDNIPNRPSQTFVIPDSVDISSFRFVFLYCSQFGVPLAFGEIN